jgi:hypothetical protein
VIFGLGLPAHAVEIDRLILDDAEMVFSVNVKAILESPLYRQLYQKDVEQFLRSERIQRFLGGTGFDPLRDLERVVIVAGPSCYYPTGTFEVTDSTPEAGPVVLVQGQFDPEKIQARLEQPAKTMPKRVELHSFGGTRGVRVRPGWDVACALFGERPYGVFLDKTTLVLAPRRQHIEDMLAKAAGKRRTKLKEPALGPLLTVVDGKQAIQFVAVGDMMVGPSEEGSCWSRRKRTVRLI